MSEENKNNWDDLAEELGTASGEGNEQPTASTPAPNPALVQQPVEYQEPTRPQSGWDSLLDNFGIDAPAPAPAPKPPKPAPVAAPQEAKPAGVDPSQPPADEIAAGQQAEVIEESVEVSQQEVFEFANEPEVARDDAFGVINQATEPFAQEPSPADAPQAEAAPQEQVTSKWDMMPKSQLALPDWFPFAGKRTKAKIEPPAPVEPPAEEADAVSQEDAEIVDAETVDGEQDTAEETAAEGGEAETQERPRRRGRRRGRRRRSSTPTEAAGVAEDEDLDTSDGSAAALGSAGDSLDSIEDDEAIEDNDDADDDADETGSGVRSTPRHRSVPSWTDAISVVVDANIAARSERKRANARNGSGSGSRGRRGGRRRGGRKPSSQG